MDDRRARGSLSLKEKILGFATVHTYPRFVSLSVDVTASSERRRAAIGLLVREGPAVRHDVKYHVMFACVIQGRVIRSIKTRVYINFLKFIFSDYQHSLHVHDQFLSLSSADILYPL